MVLGVTVFSLQVNAESRWEMPQIKQKGFVFDGKVTQSKENIRRYSVRVPVKECWTEQVRVNSGDGSATNELVGGLIGGAIGNQFGGGNGKKALTVAGALLGASIAHDGERKGRGEYELVEKCETKYSREMKEEFDGYVTKVDVQGNTLTVKTQRRYTVGEILPVKFENPRVIERRYRY